MLSPRQRKVLRALCDALIPAVATGVHDALFDSTASSLKVAEEVEGGLRNSSRRNQRIFKCLISVLDHPLVLLLLMGRPGRFANLSKSDATRFLEIMSTSRLTVVKRIFDVLKRIVMIRGYGSIQAQRAIWKQRGYPTLLAKTPTLELSDRECPDRCETLVIGSGAGGAVAAAALAARGHEVVVVEKGSESLPSSMDGIESHAMDAMFEEGGLLTTADGAISLFAGRCLGGGTTVNWSASFRLPEYVRYQWSKVFGIGWVDSEPLDEAYAAVEARTSVGVDTADDNRQNKALRSGCRALGTQVRNVPRNTRGCSGAEARSCGRCGLGCAQDRKQGMTATYLRDLKTSGGRILTGATVNRIVSQGSRVTGVEVSLEDANGVLARQIRADRIVVAAGALHTPAILRRSGFSHRGIGRNLALHPTVGVAGYYAEPMNPWEGPIMSAYSDAFASMDGPWGVRIETPPIYPGLFASALPWNRPELHRSDLAGIDHAAAFIVLTRDRMTGRVDLDGDGHPLARYKISDADLAMLLTGVIEAARIHIAAGAERVLFPYSLRKVLDSHADGDRIADLAREIFTWKWRPGLYPLFSAHQMGTCQMGGNADTAPVDPEGRVRGAEGLYVCDASIFPEASGVNPALTIQAMAYCVASQMH